MKSNLISKSKIIAFTFCMTMFCLNSIAGVILQSSTSNAQAITVTNVGGVLEYNFIIPYFETGLVAPANSFIFKATFSCASTSQKRIECFITNGAMVAGTPNHSAGTFTLGSIPSAIGTTSYDIKTGCLINSSTFNNASTNTIRIVISKASAPTINNFSLSASCNQSLNTSTMQYENNGTASLYVETGNFSNVKPLSASPFNDTYGGMYLRYTNETGSSYDNNFSSLQNTTGVISHHAINGNVNAGLHTFTLVYKYKRKGTNSSGVVYTVGEATPYFPPSGSNEYPTIHFSTLKKSLTARDVICLPPAQKRETVIYPNTVTENVVVKMEGEKINTINVYDLMNNKIKSVSFSAENEEETMALLDLKSGIYIIEVVTETSTTRKQIVKK
jgi:hypothetical protein